MSDASIANDVAQCALLGKMTQLHRVLVRGRSRLISFVIALSSCDTREERDNYKIKNSCPQWDSNPLLPAYETDTLTNFAMELL